MGCCVDSNKAGTNEANHTEALVKLQVEDGEEA